MAKRLKRTYALRSCLVPQQSSSSSSSRLPFSFYEDDVWMEISKYLDGKSLVKLSSTCKWFYKIMAEDCVWKYRYLRDIAMPDPGTVSFKWQKIYASTFGGTHSYLFRQQDKHIDWMRIGAFFQDSPAALLTEKLVCSKRMVKKDTIEKMLKSYGLSVVHNVKTGIWLADLQIARCPVCNLNTCDGTMQLLEARHFELFLNENYQNGSWDFTQLGAHVTKKRVGAASGAIFDLKHLKDDSTAEVFKTKTWYAKRGDWQPKSKMALHAVAINTNLPENDGLNVKFHVMRDGPNGQIVAIRITQQLL